MTTADSSSVSVLIPVYNRQNLIGLCIQSALDQTLAPLEIVVVDNASTDATWEVCQSFAQRDERVRIFRNERNIGPVRNWKRCIDEARGEFGKLLFSDDLIYPTFLEKTVPYLVDSTVGLIFTAVEIGSEIGQTVITVDGVGIPTIFPAADFIRDSLLGASVLSPGNALFRLTDLKRNLMTEIPSPSIGDFPDHGAGPDLLLFLLTARQYPQVAHLNEPLCLFRSHSGSITISSDRWYLFRRQQQARIWFATTYENDKISAALLASMWLAECKNEKRFLSPTMCVRQYTTRHIWSWRVCSKCSCGDSITACRAINRAARLCYPSIT